MICAPAALSLVFAACGAFEESPAVPTPAPSTTNVLADAGFEGEAPAWVGFPPGAHQLVEGVAHGGAASLALRLSPGVGALAMFQATNPTEFPEFLSGFYRLDDWEDGAYLQFVVKAQGGNLGQIREVRFVIAGVEAEPEAPPPEARYVFLSRGAPRTGEWTYFAYPIRQAFLERAGSVPDSWSSIDVSLELRSTSDELGATAYFDDIYLGPQVSNPNRPKETTN